jgi:hypothetical protein
MDKMKNLREVILEFYIDGDYNPRITKNLSMQDCDYKFFYLIIESFLLYPDNRRKLIEECARVRIKAILRDEILIKYIVGWVE